MLQALGITYVLAVGQAVGQVSYGWFKERLIGLVVKKICRGIVQTLVGIVPTLRVLERDRVRIWYRWSKTATNCHSYRIEKLRGSI